jgi:hypothetical protein
VQLWVFEEFLQSIAEVMGEFEEGEVIDLLDFESGGEKGGERSHRFKKAIVELFDHTPWEVRFPFWEAAPTVGLGFAIGYLGRLRWRICSRSTTVNQ